MKRLLTMLLALVMILSMIPMTAIPALAEEHLNTEEVPVEETTLEEPAEEPAEAPVEEPIEEPVEEPAKKNTEALTSGTCGESITWTLADGVLTISGTGYMDEYVDVTDTPWLDYLEQIQTVVVEDGVKNLANGSFMWAHNLTDVSLGNTLESIGRSAFDDCTSLTEITIPDSVTFLGTEAFCGSGLREIVLPDSITHLDFAVFWNCNNLEQVTLSKNLTSIPTGTFRYCYNLQTVEIPEKVNHIGEGAFYACNTLREVVVPESVQCIDFEAFGASVNLVKITILNPECTIMSTTSMMGSVEVMSLDAEVQTLGVPGTTVVYGYDDSTAEAFAQMYGYNFVSLGAYVDDNEGMDWEFADGVLTISGNGPMEDYECGGAPWWVQYSTKINSVEIGEGVTHIGNYAFYGCSLQSVTLPDTLRSVGEGAFENCYELEAVTLPENLEWIRSAGFANCSSLQKIILPDSVTELGDFVFMGCTELTDVVLPTGLETIGETMFSMCANLKNVVLPEKLKTIKNVAFYNCSALESITFPESLESIGDIVFVDCTSLKKIVFQADAPAFGVNLFAGVVADAYYPADNATWTEDVKQDYGGNITWVPYDEIEEPEDDVITGTCGDNLTWTLEDGVLTISGYGAMDDFVLWQQPWAEYAEVIESVIIEGNVTHVGAYAFHGCSVKTVTLPMELETIGENAFYGCGIKEVEIPVKVTSIGHSAFYGTSLTSVTIPGNVQTIGTYAFGSSALQEVEIQSGVQTIGKYAFEGCEFLTSVTIPKSVTQILDSSFGYNPKLEKIIFSGNAPQFADNVFEGLTTTVYYPSDDATWDSVIGKNFGGIITWEALGASSPTSGQCGDDVYWSVENGEMRIYGAGPMWDNPAGDPYWLTNPAWVTSVTVEEGVTSIGYMAFADHGNITSVSFPSTLTFIGTGAFNGCPIDALVIPAGVTEIGEYAFWCVPGSCLKKVTVHGTPFIGDKAFGGANIDSLTFTGDAPTFGEFAFEGASAYVNYPASNPTWDGPVGNHYGGTLTWCPDGDGPTDPDDDEPTTPGEVIDTGTCGKKLKWSITDNGILTIYGSGAMYNYGGEDQPWYDYRGNVKSIVINEGATKIGDAAFIGCRQATEISIPDTVTRIGHSAFYGCSSLTSVVVPKGVETLGDTAFAQCHSLKTAVLPDSLTTFYSGMFQGCFELESVTLPKGLKEIPVEMFAGCKLTSFEIPKTITKIRDSAFASCQAGELRIPESVTLIEMYAFRRIEEITLIFEGDAPMFGEECFSSSVITAYYPVDNKTWTSNVMQQYDGEVTWIPYCNHNDANIVGAEEATCTEPGYTGDIICPDCGNTVLGEEIPATGHDFGDWYVEVPNGYMENGEEHRDCKNCNHYESRVLEFSFTLEQVQNVRASSNKTSVKLSYDKVAGADRYEIWVDGEYVTSTTKTSYTVEDLTQGVNYEFMVVARATKNGNYLYGPGSEPIITRPYYELGNGYKMSLEETEVIYNGAEHKPAVTVRKSSSGKHDVTEGVDYTVTYENNVAIGTATVTVTGMGKFGGTLTKTFDILPDQVQNLQVEVLSEDTLQLTFDSVLGADEYWVYKNGDRVAKIKGTTYTVTDLKAGKNYKFSVKANTMVDGENYTGEESDTDSGKPVHRLEDCSMEIKHKERAHTGKSRTNSFTVKNAEGKTLKEDTDYEVVYENNKNVGTATATIIGKGKYAGTMTVTYDILPAQMDKPKAKVEQLAHGTSIYVTFDTVPQAEWFEIYLNGELYTKTEEFGHFTEYLKPGDYNITVRAGVTIDGKDYIGEASDARKVAVRHSVEHCSVSLAEEEFAYTGKSHKPAVTVYGLSGEVLTEDVDYTLSYRNNKSTGAAYVEVKGKGDYNGSQKVYFTINPAQVTGVKVSSTTKSSVKISFKKDSTNSTKYYNIYVDGEKMGRTTGSSYTIKDLTLGEIYSVYIIPEKTVSGTTYYGEASEVITVWPGTGIGSCKVTLDFTKADFTGEELCPGVVVKTSSKSSAKTLVLGEDYTVSYENNVGPGKAKVIIQAVPGSDYTGTITKTFKINPPKVENVTAVAASNTSIEVSFDAAPGATEYWVYVNGSRKAKITDTTCVIKGLKKNKTYKITVKAVATVDGDDYTSDYTDPVSCKTPSK